MLLFSYIYIYETFSFFLERFDYALQVFVYFIV